MSTTLKIVIAESSVIIRAGLEVTLKKISGFKFHIVEVGYPDSLGEALRMHHPDILLINPLFVNGSLLTQLKEENGCTDTKCFALLYTTVENSILRMFDDQVSIFDGPDEIKKKIEQVILKEIAEETDPENSQSLSVREKEIVVCVVKGMTNREIADTLYLSTHTVITHRRNIARKLQIHSTSGLTVYAIVNKLVELENIQPKG